MIFQVLNIVLNYYSKLFQSYWKRCYQCFIFIGCDYCDYFSYYFLLRIAFLFFVKGCNFLYHYQDIMMNIKKFLQIVFFDFKKYIIIYNDLHRQMRIISFIMIKMFNFFLKFFFVKAYLFNPYIFKYSIISFFWISIVPLTLIYFF